MIISHKCQKQNHEHEEQPQKQQPKTKQPENDDSDHDSEYQITPPESNYDLNVELMSHIDVLTKKLENSAKTQQDFVDAFNSLKDFSENSIKEIDIKIKKKG